MAGENTLYFVHIIKEICLMKSNKFYGDQFCTSCFDSEATKILNASRNACLTHALYVAFFFVSRVSLNNCIKLVLSF